MQINTDKSAHRIIKDQNAYDLYIRVQNENVKPKQYFVSC